ncbi:MAG: hypothetical protein PHT07_14905 [Paludibacter sp.]|nr:hypothetical protein [Paludibacter sp.]
MDKMVEIRKFDDLAQLDPEGIVPAVSLFDIVFTQIYAPEIEQDPMISCELHDDKCQVIIFDAKDQEYRFNIYHDWKIEFWFEGIPLHFNPFPVYKELIEMGFIYVKQLRAKIPENPILAEQILESFRDDTEFPGLTEIVFKKDSCLNAMIQYGNELQIK